MNRLSRFLIRVTAFLAREAFDVLRQPRLVLTLVIGPFLILLLFGLGFHNQPQSLRTLFVISDQSEIATQVEEYAANLGPQLIFSGVTDDEEEATQKLVRDEVDVVAVVPPDAYEKVRNSQQAVVDLYYYEVDPFKIDYVNVFGRVYVNEINRRILRNVIDVSQRDASDIEDSLSRARQSAAAVREALEGDDMASARLHQQRLDRNFGMLTLALGASLELLDNVQGTIGDEQQNRAAAVRSNMTDTRSNIDALGELDAEGNREPQLEQVETIEEDLAEMETLLEEFEQVNAGVLVSPFRHETKNIMPVRIRALDFFTPSVIVLLLQHLAVTFAALSIVKEEQLGTMELFQVSPISAGETLLGKYLSYFLLAGLIAAVLTLLTVFGLNVPMLGRWLSFILTTAVLIFTSLSIGFVISLVSQSDSQAVQYSMIVLLASVFFSGAFIGLQMLGGPVQVISWIIPATYGIRLLQDIMLRGFVGDIVIMLSALTGIGLLLLVVAYFLLRRRMARL